MKKKTGRDELAEAISLLKNKQELELQILRNQFKLAYESIKPINLIKNTLHQIATSSEIRNNLLNNVVGLATGFVAKKLLLGATHNPVKKILGTIFQFAVANMVANRSEQIHVEEEPEPANSFR